MNKDRRFSLEDDFMSFNIDDLLYGAMQYLASYNGNELYLSKEEFNRSRKFIYQICDLNRHTLAAHIQKLKDAGLIAQNTEEAYTFPYNYNGAYQLINYDMLKYLVCSRNRFAINIYVYLLNKYLWKQQTNEEYVFTKMELARAIGFKQAFGKCYEAIGIVLESFKREGIINYEETRQSIFGQADIITSTSRLILKFVQRYIA